MAEVEPVYEEEGIASIEVISEGRRGDDDDGDEEEDEITLHDDFVTKYEVCFDAVAELECLKGESLIAWRPLSNEAHRILVDRNKKQIYRFKRSHEADR